MQNLSVIKPPPQAVPRRRFEFNLEGLRGFAAVVVIFNHVVVHKNSLDPGYFLKGDWVTAPPGHSSVLLFFILSGYVIGLTNKSSLTRSTIGPYLSKRLIRLYPIYVVSLVFALLIARTHYSLGTIAGNFLFLQNTVVPCTQENSPLWSLNYEAVYYLAFIPISYYGIAPIRVCIAAAFLGIIFTTVLPMPLAGSYSFGFVFWSIGLWLAQSNRLATSYTSFWLLLGLLALFLGYESLNPLVLGVFLMDTKLHIHFASQFRQANVLFEDLARIPFLLYLFIRFTNYTIKWERLALSYFICSGFLYYFRIFFKYGFDAPLTSALLVPVIFLTIGTVLIVFSYSRPQPQNVVPLPTVFLKLGAISYGVYAIHFPMSLFLSHFSFFSGSLFTFSCRLLLDIALVLTAGYFLELKLQPAVKKLFMPNKDNR